jgi:hypothetical protein
MTRETARGLLIVVGLAIIGTIFSGPFSDFAGILIGTLGLIFLCVMWYFAYNWYRGNRTAISLMPDRQRNAMYAGMGAVTVTAVLYSLSRFGLIGIPAGLQFPLLLVFLVGLFAMFWAWQESKRYYL